jgi:hypothetical protein
VNPVPDSLLLRKSGSAGNRTQTTEAVTYSSKNDKFNLLTAKSWGARITTGDWGRVLSPSRAKNFSLLHIFETGSGAFSMGARAWSPPLTSNQCPGQENIYIYIYIYIYTQVNE